MDISKNKLSKIITKNYNKKNQDLMSINKERAYP